MIVKNQARIQAETENLFCKTLFFLLCSNDTWTLMFYKGNSHNNKPVGSKSGCGVH